MNQGVAVGIDVVAIVVLTFGLYFPRYRRADLVVAFLGVNAGVLAVTLALAGSTTIGAGFGLGLFGVLSIIRLRSFELDQQEVAYYFVSLALGLVGGLELDPSWLTYVLPIAILMVMFVGDHPRLFAGYRHQVLVLDRAIAGETELLARLQEVLGASIRRFEVRKIDLVNDTTTVDVRYRLTKP